ncbi:MAG: hypothetical protein HOJ07_12330, partial [Rhodospirillaceae bacterium]|nr:hypothetical protein [Rhodospirillaceae bacterium]
RSDAARDIFAKLSANAGAPGGVRSRAQEFLASLGGPLEPAQSQQSTSSDQQAQPDGAQD